MQGVEIKSNKQVAIKTFNMRLKIYMQREADCMAITDHANIVRFITFEKAAKYGHILVMELCDDCLCERILPTGLNHSEFIRLCKDLCSAVKHLRENNLVHRDIKPENILTAKSNDGQTIYKLGDFGAARQLKENENYGSCYGTYEFLHPDIFAKLYKPGLDNIDPNLLFYATNELWSIGATLYTAATGQVPFLPRNGRDDFKTMFQMITLKQRKHISATEPKAGKISWSSKLPASALGNSLALENSLKRNIESYLAGLLNV